MIKEQITFENFVLHVEADIQKWITDNYEPVMLLSGMAEFAISDWLKNDRKSAFGMVHLSPFCFVDLMFEPGHGFSFSIFVRLLGKYKWAEVAGGRISYKFNNLQINDYSNNQNHFSASY